MVLQVASPSQKMGGERMAERVWRRALRQAERAAHPRHRQLHDARRQRAAFRADEQRAGGLESIGAKRQIVLDRLAHRRNDRRRARLLALADDRDGVRFADRRVGASDRKGFGDAQARAVAEREHRGVARQAPRARALRRRASAVVVIALASGGLKGRGRRRPALGARTAPSAAAVSPPSRAIWRASDLRAESARCSERPSTAFRPPVGEKGAQIAWRAIGEIGDARRRAETLPEKGEKLPGVAAISLDRARRQAPLVGEMVKPGGRRRGEVGRGGEMRSSVEGGTLAWGRTMPRKGLSGGCVGGRDWREAQKVAPGDARSRPRKGGDRRRRRPVRGLTRNHARADAEAVSDLPRI